MQFNLAGINETIESAFPDRECVIFRDKRLTYRQFGDRTRQLANLLRSRGLGEVTPRSELEGHESGQDHLAIYLHNGNEYLEAMVGSYKARVAPFNVNYRYVAEELLYLLEDSRARAIVYHSAFAPTLAEVLDDLPELTVLLQVADGSGNDLLEGAQWYEESLAGQPTEIPSELRDSWSADDLYVLYTGGTTGMPKGVLWRQDDIFMAALGGRRLDTGEDFASLEELAENAAAGGAKVMPGPPFMHGAAHWMAFNAFNNGNTIVIPNVVEHLDVEDLLGLVESEGIVVLLIVGDAFGRPLIDRIEAGADAGKSYDLSSLFVLVSGGAALSSGIKARFLEAVPSMMIMDGLGSSEAGQQASQMSSAGEDASTGDFVPGPDLRILSEDMTRVLAAGEDETGWLAQQGRAPLGYLGDAAKTARTFPVVDGIRYSVPGDRARISADGNLELFGRDSVTINSGGEKIFAEEVESAILQHPAVDDCVVAGRPSERWGNEVIAVVQLKADISDEDLLAEAARHVARYKLPKGIVRRDEILRSPAGKADYRWAKEQAIEG